MPRGRGRGRRTTGRKWKTNNYMNYGNKGYKGSNFSYGQVLDKMTGDVTRLMGLLNTEFKQKDITASQTINNVAKITLLNGLSKGDDFDDRDGRVVRVKSIQISLIYEMSTVATFTQMRIMVVLDKQPNEMTLVINDLLDSSALQSFRNLDNRKRFVILRNEIVSMSISGAQGGYFEYYKKFNLKTIYDDSDVGDIADISTNAIYLILLSNEPTNLPTVIRSTRVRYIDN